MIYHRHSLGNSIQLLGLWSQFIFWDNDKMEASANGSSNSKKDAFTGCISRLVALVHCSGGAWLSRKATNLRRVSSALTVGSPAIQRQISPDDLAQVFIRDNAESHSSIVASPSNPCGPSRSRISAVTSSRCSRRWSIISVAEVIHHSASPSFHTSLQCGKRHIQSPVRSVNWRSIRIRMPLML